MKWLCCLLIVTTTAVCTLQIGAHAMLAPAQFQEQTASPESNRAQDMKAVQAALESKAVRQRLKQLGLSDEQIQSRLDKLSDQQLHQLAGQAQALSAGGDDGGGVVIGLLLITLLVLLIVYLAKRI